MSERTTPGRRGREQIALPRATLWDVSAPSSAASNQFREGGV